VLRPIPRRWLVATAAFATLAAPAPSAAQWRAPASCSVSSQNLFVRDVMTDIYFWYKEMPTVNPTRYNSPDDYLNAVRYQPLDTRFSYIGMKAAEDAFYSDSQYIGFGFASSYDGSRMWVAQVFPDSPASEAGLVRGHRFVEINGQTIEDLAANGQLGGAFGPSQDGYEVELVYEKPDGERVRVRMAKRIITIPTVTATQVYALEDGRKVGYVFFRNFVEPSFSALSEAFATLKAAGATELVLDLRYNGGGLVSVAQHLASLIGGSRTSGQLLAEYFHNDRNAFRNRELRFEDKEQALQLERLVVITTGSSASASELIINALRPFIPVITVGSTSYGKPVGQYGITFCDRVLYPVAFTLRNANGEGDYFDGFAPTCPAADEVGRQLGDPAEGSLGEALTFLRTGACTPPRPDTAEPARRVERRGPRATGFQAVLNAW
jgi:C-terminal processing protease CtpA/Prc